MILRIIIVAVILIAGLLAFAATRPKTFHLERSIVIRAAPDKIFVLINDLHHWSDWSPQDKDDPNMQRSFSGATAGEGAVSQWRGSGSTGQGRMVITESVPNRKVLVTVDFVKPFEARNINAFTLEPAGDATKLTWDFTGTNVLVLKLMSVFVSMDRVMGKHFEAGLENLKSAAEAGSHSGGL